MKIYVTRHGQTDWNVQGKTQGRADIELNEVGIKQAKQTKEELKNIDIDLIICSPLKRAKKTAEIINEGRNIPIIFDDQIIERNFGEFEGEKIKFDEFWDYNAHPRYQRAETIQEIISRISNFLDKIKEEYKDKNVAMKKVMKIKLLKRYKIDEFIFEKLNKYGIKWVRGPRGLTDILSKGLNL